jgi:hypothetical protein
MMKTRKVSAIMAETAFFTDRIRNRWKKFRIAIKTSHTFNYLNIHNGKRKSSIYYYPLIDDEKLLLLRGSFSFSSFALLQPTLKEIYPLNISLFLLVAIIRVASFCLYDVECSEHYQYYL